MSTIKFWNSVVQGITSWTAKYQCFTITIVLETADAQQLLPLQLKKKKSTFSWLSVAFVLRNKSNYYSSSLLVARTDISSKSVRHYWQINAYDILGRMLSYYSVKSHKENGFYWQRQTVKCSNIKKSTVSFKNPRKTIHIKNQTNGPYQFKNVLKRAQNQVHDSWSN